MNFAWELIAFQGWGTIKWFRTVGNGMMTSSNGCIFPVTGPLWGESTGHRWIPLTKASDGALWCFHWSMPEQTFEQTIATPVIWDIIALIMPSLWLEMANLRILVGYCSILLKVAHCVLLWIMYDDIIYLANKSTSFCYGYTAIKSKSFARRLLIPTMGSFY